MNYDDETLDFLEQQIPEMAAAAVKQAYWNALASGSSVLVSDTDGVIREIFPNGTSRFVEQGEPYVKIKKGITKISE